MEYATDVCACSVLAADWLFGSKIPRDRIRILPNAVDAGKYRFDPIRRQIIRESLNLEGRIVIGNVGRYSYQKNQEFLIKAIFGSSISQHIVTILIRRHIFRQL